jgi:hypothetical protein
LLENATIGFTVRRINIILIVVAAVFLMGCDLRIDPNGFSPSQPMATSTPLTDLVLITEVTSVNGGTFERAPTATHEPQLDPPTPTPTPTWAPPASPNCLEPSAHGDLAETSYEDTPQEILTYLNEGSSPEELAVELMLRDINVDQQPVVVDDLTADGLYEVIVTILNPQSPPQGALLIYTCQGEQYALTHIEASGAFIRAPVVIYIGDINVDGQNELIISSSSCGAHTCYEDVRILSWTGSHFESRLEGDTSDLPYPRVQLTDYDRDGVYDFEATGTAVGSVGAGPQRDLIKVWKYDAGTGFWNLDSEAFGPSNFRIHVVYDADKAMRRGEYQIAFLLYQQVITDDKLLDWMNPDYERRNLSAYAYFKQVVTSAMMGDIDQMTDIYADMTIIYQGQELYAFAEMALAFLTGFAAGGEQEGCAAAHQFAAQHPDTILTPLGSTTYGYFNPDYEPEDICP